MKTKAMVAVCVLSLLLMGTVFGAGCGGPAEEEEEEEPIKLGAAVPLSDVTGFQASRAMQLAVEEINAAGGVLGRQLELIVEDEGFTAETGVAALEKLANVDKVDIFMGGMASGAHLGEIPTLKTYEKVTVWIGAASYLCEEALAGSDWYFHLHPWDYEQTQSYIRAWHDIEDQYSEINLDNWFIAYENGAFGASSWVGFEELWPLEGWNVTGESFLTAALGGGDYRSVLGHAKDAEPDAFIWVGYDADALPIVEQAKEVEFEPPLFIGSPPGWPADFGESVLSENVVLYGMWAPSISEVSDVSAHFYEAYVEKWNEEPATYFAPLGYTAVYFVAEGIKNAGTLDKDALIGALAQVELEETAVGEKLTIKPSNNITHQGFTDQKILQWQGGEQQVIWPFDLATAELVYPFQFGG